MRRAVLAEVVGVAAIVGCGGGTGTGVTAGTVSRPRDQYQCPFLRQRVLDPPPTVAVEEQAVRQERRGSVSHDPDVESPKASVDGDPSDHGCTSLDGG